MKSRLEATRENDGRERIDASSTLSGQTLERSLAGGGHLRAMSLAGLVLIALLGGRLVAQEQEPPAEAEVEPAALEVVEEAFQEEGDDEDLIAIELEELMDMEITSVSRKLQKLSAAAAAISVVTSEDIRRLGFQSIPEALRIVPGVHVAQINRHRWSVAARGFGDEFANKLQVAMDGRSLYTPLFAGTFWDVQDTVLEDLDRIEVIRGPGATLWGANAVNGVINIMTKPADETQGWLIGGGYGTEDNGWGQIRYGGQLGDDAWFRVYGKWFDRDGYVDAQGDDTNSDWDTIRGGFRMDWYASSDDHLTFQGDIYGGHVGEFAALPIDTFPYVLPDDSTTDIGGGNLLARWTRTLSEDSDFSLQVYYDHTQRDWVFGDEHRDTFDLDFQHRLMLGESNELIWGLGYRVSWDDFNPSPYARILPDRRSTQLFSVFVQDSIDIIDDELIFTIGSKFEHNDFSGFEIQPSARLLWAPSPVHTLWGAVSRAVRSPSRAEHDLDIGLQTIPPIGPNPAGILTVTGNSDFDSEKLWAFELGYRLRPCDDLSFDLALYYHDYDDFRTLNVAAPFVDLGTGTLIYPHLFDNDSDGESYGVELAATWNVTPDWRLVGQYTFNQVQLHRYGSSGFLPGESEEGDFPHHQFGIQSYLDITEELQLNLALFYVDTVPDRDIPSYTRLDAQIAWMPAEEVTLRLGVHNILDDRHPEFSPSLPRPQSEVERTGYVSVEVRF